jgi:hypothetical protein
VFKLVIEIPSEILIEFDEFALEIVSSESEDKMNDLGLVEVLLLLLHLIDLNGSFAKIDVALAFFDFRVHYLHEVSGAHSEQLPNILNSFPSGVGSQNHSFHIVVLQ